MQRSHENLRDLDPTPTDLFWKQSYNTKHSIESLVQASEMGSQFQQDWDREEWKERFVCCAHYDGPALWRGCMGRLHGCSELWNGMSFPGQFSGVILWNSGGVNSTRGLSILSFGNRPRLGYVASSTNSFLLLCFNYKQLWLNNRIKKMNWGLVPFSFLPYPNSLLNCPSHLGLLLHTGTPW